MFFLYNFRLYELGVTDNQLINIYSYLKLFGYEKFIFKIASNCNL